MTNNTPPNSFTPPHVVSTATTNTATPSDPLPFLTATLKTLMQGQDLGFDAMSQLMQIIMSGSCPDTLLAGILVALAIKGETIDEITAAAVVTRQFAKKAHLPITDHSIDIVGTGGDGANLFNVSTAAAFVMASAGADVIKHGNAGVSTHSGASDFLSQCGIAMTLDDDKLLKGLAEHHFAFLFAPNYHQAMRHAKTVRATLKLRTIFNSLGPLVNPANTPNALIGTYSPTLCQPLAQVMKNLNAKHVAIVHSQDGLDEISLATPTLVSELNHGQIKQYTLSPEELGISSQPLDGLSVKTSEDSFRLVQQALAGANDNPIIQKAQAMIALNAGMGLYIANVCATPKLGVQQAQAIINGGQALATLRNYATFSQT